MKRSFGSWQRCLSLNPCYMTEEVFVHSLMPDDALFLFPQETGPVFVGLSDILPHILLP